MTCRAPIINEEMIHKDPNCFCKRAYFCCKVQHFYVNVYDRSLWWPPEELQVFFHLIISPNSDQRNLQKTQSRHRMFHVLLWGRLQTPHHSAGHQLMGRLVVQFPAAPVCVPNILMCSSVWILDQKHLDVERCLLWVRHAGCSGTLHLPVKAPPTEKLTSQVTLTWCCSSWKCFT